MKSSTLVLVVLLLLTVTSSCKLLNRTTSRSKGPAIDFSTPGKALNVTVQLDKKQTASKLVPRTGGSVSLTALDGSKFMLDVPPNALDADTMITMTTVKSIEGAPLGADPATAVQLEPSGLFFKELATLTIVPAKEIPIKNQIIFGYEGEGKDYHLAVVDSKSKDIKIKLMQFSGAGVGNSDSAWAANLQIQASDARTRLLQKFGELTQGDRKSNVLGGDENEAGANFDSIVDQFFDQVILKDIAAAELDCKFAQQGINDLLILERLQKALGGVDSAFATKGFAEKMQRLTEIRDNCKAPYRIVGGLDAWQTNTEVCDIMKPFTLTGGGFTMKLSGGLSGTYSYTGPFNANGTGTYTISLPDGIGKPGTMIGGGAGEITGDRVYTGKGTERYTLTPIEPCK
jgi:hypothetical protein